MDGKGTLVLTSVWIYLTLPFRIETSKRNIGEGCFNEQCFNENRQVSIKNRQVNVSNLLSLHLFHSCFTFLLLMQKPLPDFTASSLDDK